MSYIRYDVDVTQGMYADYERLRKDYVGKKLRKESVLTMLDLCGLPSESPKVFELALKYEILLKGGKARGTYYMVPKSQVPYSRFEGLEKDFYNGSKPKPKAEEKPKVEEKAAIKREQNGIFSNSVVREQARPQVKETGRVVLDEDYCLRYLKERGYMCFKLRPNLLKLQQVFTPQFLLENMDAELK